MAALPETLPGLDLAGFLTMDARFVLEALLEELVAAAILPPYLPFYTDARFALVFAGGICGGGAFAANGPFLQSMPASH